MPSTDATPREYAAPAHPQLFRPIPAADQISVSTLISGCAVLPLVASTAPCEGDDTLIRWKLSKQVKVPGPASGRRRCVFIRASDL